MAIAPGAAAFARQVAVLESRAEEAERRARAAEQALQERIRAAEQALQEAAGVLAVLLREIQQAQSTRDALLAELRHLQAALPPLARKVRSYRKILDWLKEDCSRLEAERAALEERLRSLRDDVRAMRYGMPMGEPVGESDADMDDRDDVGGIGKHGNARPVS